MEIVCTDGLPSLLFPEFHRYQVLALDQLLRLVGLEEVQIGQHQIILGALDVSVNKGPLDDVAVVRDGIGGDGDPAHLQGFDPVADGGEGDVADGASSEEILAFTSPVSGSSAS